MPISTPLTSLLGCTHPILSAPMAGIAGARLVATVSEAGGFGILGGRRNFPKVSQVASAR
jgi:nitronate monooxygenase